MHSGLNDVQKLALSSKRVVIYGQFNLLEIPSADEYMPVDVSASGWIVVCNSKHDVAFAQHGSS